MSSKKPHGDEETSVQTRFNTKRSRKGFSVGPENLPDGTYRRKAQKIKRSLINKAKLRKQYSKIKQRASEIGYDYGQPIHNNELAETMRSSVVEIHPDRQSMLGQSVEDISEIIKNGEEGRESQEEKPASKARRSKPMPFGKEVRLAQLRRLEAEARRKAREEANLQRKWKIEERERFRAAMAKARAGGKNGQRRLGRESNILLEKVQKLMTE